MTTQTRTHPYQAVAYRDGRWWTFEIPELTTESPRGTEHRVVAMGQARTVSELAGAARDVAALWLDVDKDSVNVTVTVHMPEDAQELWEASAAREEEGRAAVKEAAQLKRAAVQALTAKGITQRDAALLLGISTQRINQLVHTS